MTTKEKLLEFFEINKGRYFSGEELAEHLRISRAAVWKAVNTLRQEGYRIDAVTNKGYCLSSETDILSPQGIKKYLTEDIKNIELNVLQTVDSTNTYLKKKITDSMPELFTVISNEQTAGRGRRGRSFFSPDGSGIYMSIYLKPQNYTAKESVRITTMAAVAMCEAIEEVSDLSPKIKWVNDIFVDGKKVCGILTEAALNVENGNLDYAVLGVGINIYKPHNDFPEEILNIADALFELPLSDMKNKISAAFINHFYKYYKSLGNEYSQKYREYSLVIGKEVQVLSDSEQRMARVLDIDDECRLELEFSDGKRSTLSYGEISIKL